MKTSELKGAALDWAVAKCDGEASFGWTAEGTERTALLCIDETWRKFKPSTNWAQGGPIIEREGINLDNYAKNPDWGAWVLLPGQAVGDAQAYGCTPLIAAMRCYVASKLGDTIEIPKEFN